MFYTEFKSINNEVHSRITHIYVFDLVYNHNLINRRCSKTASIFTKIGTLKFSFESKYMKICNSIINTICRNQSSHISLRYQWQLLPFKVAFTRANLGVRSSRIWQTANPHLSAGYLKDEKQDEKWLMIMGRRMCWKG